MTDTFLPSQDIQSRKLPDYGIAGIAIIILSELFCYLKVDPFYTYMTPFCWTGFILFIDSIIYLKKRESLIQSRTAEFILMLVLSIILWLVFEIYNYLLQNWHYVGLPDYWFWHYFGYAWSFATIWPAIFETAELMDMFLPHIGKANNQPLQKIPQRFIFWSVFTGLLALIYPILYPSPYLFAYVWLGFIFLLDPINYTFSRPSLLAEWQKYSSRKFWILMSSGYICGLLWEFWNYWAGAKWIYTVPIGPRIHIFEMPIVGFLGFGPFALECFVMYSAVTGLAGWGKLKDCQKGIGNYKMTKRNNIHNREVEF